LEYQGHYDCAFEDISSGANSIPLNLLIFKCENFVYNLSFVAFYIFFFTKLSASYKASDSLYKAKKYDSSLYTFEEAFEKLSNSDVPIPENDWQQLFMGAGNSASARGNYNIARKYWNLAKGSRGEKVDDKVELNLLSILEPASFRR
jgi:tetratricopeptide (TPR) repeat protein